ncbi:TRAP transporter small permease [Castellaniella sp.]|uniref:TRAP transporter small permease n=1 Tax=Castellaniella sp. TaxID=1955812 RepID=UPI003C70ECE0
MTADSEAMMTQKKHKFLIDLSALLFRISDVLGHIAAAALIVLTIALTLGVGLRLFRVDSSWTYNIGLFSLMWVAFIGASYCALRDFHVTAGISIEHFIHRGHRVIVALRYVVLLVFLAVFLFSAWNKFLETLLTHQRTVDSLRWELWIAQISAPIGIGGWLLADLGKFIRKMIDPEESYGEEVQEDFSV